MKKFTLVRPLTTASFLFVVLALLPFVFLKTPETTATNNARISEGCAGDDCHDDALKDLQGTAHRVTLPEHGALIACTDCHPGDERHLDDPEDYAFTDPEDVGADVAARICATCHENSHQQNMEEKNVHLANDLSCSQCHLVHGNEHAALLKKEEVSLCLDCHAKTEGEFAKPYRHPVADGVVKCSECHSSVDESNRRLNYGGDNESCYKCHNQYRGPFPFEHQATVDYSTEEGGCLNCHEAHGSHEPRLLKQSYQSPNFALCSQCHAVPKHKFNIMHGTQWADIACNECHSDVHGSYVSKNLLTPSLQGQGCFNVGCHSF